MQLRVARLCLNCDELHQDLRCPVCASETFAFVSRWIPAPERRAHPRAEPPPASVATPMSKRRLAGYGALGLAAAGLARWWWKTQQGLEAAALRGAGELK